MELVDRTLDSEGATVEHVAFEENRRMRFPANRPACGTNRGVFIADPQCLDSETLSNPVDGLDERSAIARRSGVHGKNKLRFSNVR